MKVERPSSLIRSIDLDYPTNRVIVIITLLFLFGITGLQLVIGKDISSALYLGLRAGTSVFLTWAFARELDPDNELSAFFAAFLGCAGFLFFPSPFLLALFLELLLIRIVNRSTGRSSKTFDSLAVLLLSGWISLQGNWIFGLFTALAFFLDAFLPAPNRQNRIFGVAAFTSVLFFLPSAGQESTYLDMQSVLFLFSAAILFIPIVLRSRKIKSGGDMTGSPLNPLRVQAAQLTALLSAGLLTALRGWAGAESLMPLWGAILGVSLYGLLTHTTEKIT
ncbi:MULTISPECIES: hypothetical protein [unclassified Methanosarcina]|uniref:hypothetical protein n=1 Tax=unclassified Methanosarcina TaxID=2644672 RepID=UPI00064F3C2B|nr:MULTISPECIES: hypothetical protein [unclassified Methanosarcina]